MYVKNYLYVILGESSSREDGRLKRMEKFDPNIRKISHEGKNWVCSPGTTTPDC